jgi:alkyldihydroxyacetonephosphate synthase
MNKIIKVNEVNSTVTVQPGIYGPALENYLNRCKTGYTCGHFPQSFEFSTVGGWVVTRGAGQASTGYGKIEDMVLSMRMVTPRGIVETRDYPAGAIGPDIDQVLMGSEGAFGVLTEVTMKVRKYRPRNTRHVSFLFKDFGSAVRAMREAMQGEFGKPHLFRISDPEETDAAFGMKGLNGSFTDRVLRMLGYEPVRRCLMFAAVEGDAGYAGLVAKKLSKTARANGALSLGASPTKKWLEQRYSSAYLRDPLMDLGIMTDTLETAVSWENLLPLWDAVRAYIKSRPRTVCMVHISHVYENGANLYFTFLSPMKKGNDIDDFVQYHKGIIDTVQAHGGSLSHHHGVGRLTAPWMRGELGTVGHGLIQAVKDYLDPRGIMNPGGILGLKR